ncbi:transmembrane protein, putative (macronuclear) [Tetrahymena thermophila SB210]|uniref:Transmembrane protein, putative n=1 Tax=Tetrahymena thermophila (strain SB210) TaxID=312017 RepID=Q22TD1_TETTS|nr:transmembrane protein, putative [Tetrahymena thermophila SB210]EAR88507.2 transmembrane protein, putative [Tetrahymena thermophila SB210]|eukprot:XP_001008752.2 transmembrane protein, putative [Tetrahymena thermophila SB210]
MRKDVNIVMISILQILQINVIDVQILIVKSVMRKDVNIVLFGILQILQINVIDVQILIVQVVMDKEGKVALLVALTCIFQKVMVLVLIANLKDIMLKKWLVINALLAAKIVEVICIVINVNLVIFQKIIFALNAFLTAKIVTMKSLVIYVNLVIIQKKILVINAFLTVKIVMMKSLVIYVNQAILFMSKQANVLFVHNNQDITLLENIVNNVIQLVKNAQDLLIQIVLYVTNFIFKLIQLQNVANLVQIMHIQAPLSKIVKNVVINALYVIMQLQVIVCLLRIKAQIPIKIIAQYAVVSYVKVVTYYLIKNNVHRAVNLQAVTIFIILLQTIVLVNKGICECPEGYSLEKLKSPVQGQSMICQLPLAIQSINVYNYLAQSKDITLPTDFSDNLIVITYNRKLTTEEYSSFQFLIDEGILNLGNQYSINSISMENQNIKVIIISQENRRVKQITISIKGSKINYQIPNTIIVSSSYGKQTNSLASVILNFMFHFEFCLSSTFDIPNQRISTPQSELCFFVRSIISFQLNTSAYSDII